MKAAARIFGIAVLAALAASPAASYDFGLSLTNTPKYLGEEFSYTLAASPWFSLLPGPKLDLYLSGMAEMVADEEETDFRFDLGRTQVVYRPRPGMTAEAGRLSVSDTAGLVMSGLYDGVRFSSFAPFGRITLGGYYTGLLNKERAGIVISRADAADASSEDEYFAPRRAVAAAGFDVPAAGVGLDLIGQFDLREGDEGVHTQYAALRFSRGFLQTFSLRLAGVGAVAQVEGGDSELSYAVDGELGWFIPSILSDRLYVGALSGSAGSGDLTAYMPIKGPSAGKVFSPEVAGFTVLRAGYFLRPFETLSTDLSSRIFLSSGADGAGDPSLDSGADELYLGTEVYASLVFAPTSEFSLILGSGIFIPNSAAFIPDTESTFLVSLAAVVSF